MSTTAGGWPSRPVALGVAAALLLLVAVAGCATRPPAALPGPYGAEWAYPLPAGFPPPRVPAANPMSPAKVELGRRLFADERFSGNGTASCASCHRPELAFTDGHAQAIGATGEMHRRNSMSLVNVAYNAHFNWADAATSSLEEQMLVPMFGVDPVELGIRGREAVVLQRLAADAELRRLFAEAFPGPGTALTLGNAVRAIAAYERTLLAADSPYDRYAYWGETDRFGEHEQRGMRLFFSERLACGECHGGFTLSSPPVYEGGPSAAKVFHNTGLYDVDGRGAYPASDRGLLDATGEPQDMGAFRAPSLRNIALTAPYMHDGSVPTLDAVIDHYAAGGRSALERGSPSPLRSSLLRGFELTPSERADLLAFLEALTDPRLLEAPLSSAVAAPPAPPPHDEPRLAAEVAGGRPR